MPISPNQLNARSGPNLSPDQPGNGRGREGRTPPPAPSAAYAKRAREIMEDEVGMAPYINVAAEEQNLSTVAGSYRRARAG